MRPDEIPAEIPPPGRHSIQLVRKSRRTGEWKVQTLSEEDLPDSAEIVAYKMIRKIRIHRHRHAWLTFFDNLDAYRICVD